MRGRRDDFWYVIARTSECIRAGVLFDFAVFVVVHDARARARTLLKAALERLPLSDRFY